MNEDEFWAAIHLLGGRVTPASIERLRSALEQLEADDLVAFQTHLEQQTGRLSSVALEHHDGVPSVGDGRRALELAVVAAGGGLLADVTSDPEGVTSIPEEDDALLLDCPAREVYEDRGLSWPDVDLWRDIGKRQVVTAYIPNEDVPDVPFVRGLKQVLQRWETSDAYADAAHALGLHAFWCLGDVRDPDPHWGGKPGTHWRSRRGPGVIEVDFVVDLDDFPDAGLDDAERFVRDLIDKLAKRRGLPDSVTTLGRATRPSV